jgi:membrane protease YdiL (CAAX protease family)
MQDQSINVNSETRSVPWTGIEILATLYLVWFIWPLTVSFVLKSVGVEHWYYPEDTPKMELRFGLWVRTFALPFQAITIPLLFSAFSATRPDQLGLTTRHLGRNFLAGFASWLILTPLVFGIFTLLRYLYSQSSEHVVEPHPLETLGRNSLFPAEWVLLIFSALVAAPLLEELTFRGVLQPWLAVRSWGGHVAMLGALMMALRARWEPICTAWQQGSRSLALAATPALLVLALVPIYWFVWWRSRTPLGPALFGTSLLFAYIHAEVWPSPIPLFVLSLGLGTLASRSGSLVGPVVLHSLFNAVSCVQLVMDL